MFNALPFYSDAVPAGYSSRIPGQQTALPTHRKRSDPLAQAPGEPFHLTAVFTTEAEARAAGYCEPTYYKGDHIILGKSLDVYHMAFYSDAVPAGYSSRIPGQQAVPPTHHRRSGLHEHKKVHGRPTLKRFCDPGVCDCCQYIGEGDFLCDTSSRNSSLVLMVMPSMGRATTALLIRPAQISRATFCVINTWRSWFLTGYQPNTT